MRWLDILILRWRSVFRRGRVEHELARELRFHLDGLAAEFIARGMTPEDARAAALREMGGLEQIKEHCRDTRRVSWLEQTLQDVKYGLRTLRKHPGFTAIAVATLALGIGANTAIFSAVDTVLLRPLPFPDADALVMIWEDASHQSFARNTPAPGNYFDWQAQNAVFTDVAAIRSRSANLTGDAEPELVMGRAATPNLFAVLGVQPAIGRPFTVEEDRSKAKVVVLTYGLWQRRYGGDPNLVGRTIHMDGVPYTVTGVLPPGFCFPDRDTQFFWPAGLETDRHNRGNHFLRVVARLKPGVSLDRAQGDMRQIARRLERQYPATNTNIGASVVSLRDDIAGPARSALLVLLAAAGCVLLIACANLGNLLLARSTTRRREIAVRKALGASQPRLVRQLMTESVVLAMIGGGVGLALGQLGSRLLADLIPIGLPAGALALDGRVLMFASGATFATVLLFGVLPALKSTRVDVNDALKRESSRSVGGSSRVRSALVVGEVALAVVLLVGAALMIQTLRNMHGAGMGFRPDHLLTMRTVLPVAKYPGQQARANFFERVLQRVRMVPGVRAAAFATNLPFTSIGNTTSYVMEGRPAPPPGNNQDTLYRAVTREYFVTMGARIIAGRDFNADDRAAKPLVAVINEYFARLHWGTASPIGSRIQLGGPDGDRYAIVGVVADLRERGLDPPMKPAAYLLIEQDDAGPGAFLVIRADTDPLSMTKTVTEALWSVDKNQPVSSVRSMDTVIASQFQDRRLQMDLLVVFAGLALTLACLGIYGVLSYLVTQRTREIGMRVTLGANPRQVARMFVRQGLGLTGVGMTVGVAGSVILARAMQTMLYGVAPTDPRAYVTVAVVLAGVALAACYLPARRASHLDPVVALRDD